MVQYSTEKRKKTANVCINVYMNVRTLKNWQTSLRLSKQYETSSLETPLTHQLQHYSPGFTTLQGCRPPGFAIMMSCMRHKRPVSALWGWMKEGGGGGVWEWASKEDHWPVHSGERRCHRLPYLKEMRRAEEGGTGRERKRVKREKEKGNVIFQGDCPKSLPVL